MARKRRWILLGLALPLAVAALVVAALSFSGTVGGGFGPGGREWEEEVLEEGGPKKVAMVSVVGEITSEAGPFGEGASTGKVLSQLEQAMDDEDVAAVVLDLDTPGGTVVASDVIYRKIREVRKSGTPVVALMEEVAASGGYYVASGADEIVANPATLTGSIGVILVVANVQEAADKVGIAPVVLKSGPHKDIASPFREMTPEERGILQGVIDEAYGQFIGVVAEGRRLPEARAREIGDGRIYTGRQAKDLGLVDHLGGREEALERARALAKAPRASLVRYTRSPGILGSVLGVPPSFSSRNLLKEGLGIDLKPGLKYLWLP